MSTSKLKVKEFQPPKHSEFLTIKKKRTYKKACELCHKRHFSCNGKRPCEACMEREIDCKDYTRKTKVKSTADSSKPLKKRKANKPIENIQKTEEILKIEQYAHESPDKNEDKVVNGSIDNEPAVNAENSIYNKQHYSQRESSHSPYIESNSSLNPTVYNNIRPENNRFQYENVYDKAGEVFLDDSSSSGSSYDSYTTSSVPISTMNAAPPTINELQLLRENNFTYEQLNFQKKMMKKQKKKERLEICKYLGPKGFEIMFQSDIDLLHQHFPLVPLDDPNEGNFNRESLYYPEDEDVERNDENSLNGNAFSNYKIVSLENKVFIPDVLERDNQGNQKKGRSFIMELDQSDKSHIIANSEWTHSLQYTKPSDIYSKITQPFLHTHGFTALLEYIKKRFHKKDVIKICYDIAAIRPVFIASCINFQEEDMVFMEHCFQRTLLEYASFINEVGNPTIVWRRTGQISYVNDEFLMLTGWTRQQLLGKMTFVIEILDDESSLVFFKNFKAVCYSDYTGFVNVPTMRLLTPQKGKYIECSSFFIVKRDTFGLPTFTVGNFLPK